MQRSLARSLANGGYKLPVIHTEATFPFNQTIVDQLAASSLKKPPLLEYPECNSKDKGCPTEKK